ncbi:MAG: thioredoxin-disulfide reductase [Clostridia bacterium]
MFDIAIIGGGPAGLTALLYAARSGKSAVLFEELFIGGQVVKTSDIRNYPGFPNGIDGFTIAEKMETQARSLGGIIKREGVLSIDLENKRIKTDVETYEAKTIILAMGAKPRKLGLPEEDQFVGSGISYCATCDGAFFADKTVCVVGGGDTAFFDALYLSSICKKVYIIHRRNEFRANVSMINAAFSRENIEPVKSAVVEKIIGDASLNSVLVRSTIDKTEREILVDGIFVAIGIAPSTALVKDKLTLDNGGFIITDENMGTSVQGIFAAGDVRNTVLRQIVTAASDGAIAATSAVMYLSK